MQRVDAERPLRQAPDDGEQAQLSVADLIRAQHGHMPGVLLGSAIFATLLGVTLEQLTPFLVAAWLAAAYGNSCVRYVLWLGFKHARPALEDLPRWERRFAVSAGIAGLTWGAGGLLLHLPGSFTEETLVLLVMVGMALMAMLIAASSLAAFIAFTYPVLILSAVPYFLAGDPVSFGIGSATVLLLPLMTRFAYRLRQESRGSLEVRLRNAQLFAQLREQKKAAEEASLAKSRFLAMASHDLRQPLHALSLFVLTLQESSALPCTERQLVVNIRRSVDTLEELFDALLDISRLDAGAVHARVQTFALEDLFERLRFEFGAVAQQKGLRFRAAKSAALVRSDPELLAQVLRNLLSNAMRYTDRGGVLLGSRRRGEHVRIEVWDTGCGIPVDKQALVFQEFTQLANPERDRRKGLGLGLAIVERLARLLGHTIELSSVAGRGSVFAVTLPRGRSADTPVVDADTGSHGNFDLSGILALVIDDEAASRHRMEGLLARWRCEVIAAASGAEVVEKLAGVRRTPDIIIADYRLREEADGVALIERLRGEFNSDVPALLITAATAAERRDCEASGVPVLPKPVSPARLRTLLAHIAGRSAACERRAAS